MYCCVKRQLVSKGDRVYCEACGRAWDGPVSYQTISGLTMDDIRVIFTETEDEKVDYTMNWLFLSTSGVHGSYTTLKDLEDPNYVDDPDEPRWKDGKATITAMYFQPRRLMILYNGEMEITREDIPFLRDVISKSLKGVADSQIGNLPQH